MSAIDRLNAASLNTDINGVGYRGLTLSQLRLHGASNAALLAVAKQWLADETDATAEQLRGRLLTPGTGQALEYQEVQAQATAATATPSAATPTAYPMLAATIGVDIDPQTSAPATDVLGVARSILAAHAAWAAIGATIREARLKGKAAIAATATIEAAAAGFDAIEWPTPAA